MLTSLDRVKTLYASSVGDGRDETIDDCIAAASALLERIRPLERPASAIVRWFDGSEASGPGRDQIRIPRMFSPIVNVNPDFVTVEEDGVALTVFEGYSATPGDVQIRNANAHRQCALYRIDGPWGIGAQNVKVSFKYGYTAAAMPDDIVQLASEIAWFMFQTQHWIGKASQSAAGHTVSFEKSLSVTAKETLRRLRMGTW